MRFRLLLVASGCVVGCAHSEGDFTQIDVKSTRALAEKPSDLDFSDASLKGARVFSEKAGAERIALLRRRQVILRPSRVAFQIPQAWLDHYDSPPKYPVENLRELVSDPSELDRYYAPRNNLHFVREELDRVKSGEGNEWDVTFAKVVNDLLPFEKCVFHGGSEGWGEQGHSFADLQMRVYVGNWELAEIQKLVGGRGLSAVRKMSQDAFAQLRTCGSIEGLHGRDGRHPPGCLMGSQHSGWMAGRILNLPHDVLRLRCHGRDRFLRQEIR